MILSLTNSFVKGFGGSKVINCQQGNFLKQKMSCVSGDPSWSLVIIQEKKENNNYSATKSILKVKLAL